jgi:hypothetical protein
MTWVIVFWNFQHCKIIRTFVNIFISLLDRGKLNYCISNREEIFLKRILEQILFYI